MITDGSAGEEKESKRTAENGEAILKMHEADEAMEPMIWEVAPKPVRPWQGILGIAAFIAFAYGLTRLAFWLRTAGVMFTDVAVIVLLGVLLVLYLRRRMVRFVYELHPGRLLFRRYYGRQEQTGLTVRAGQICSLEKAGPYAMETSGAERVDYFCFRKRKEQPHWLLVYDDGARHAVLFQPEAALVERIYGLMDEGKTEETT